MEIANPKKRKFKRRSSAIMAAVLVIALLLTGTFAYVSKTQTALNEAEGEVDNDVILHDDFDPDADFEAGAEKSVYAENTGDSPLYVRIRLDEYMEIAGVSMVDGAVKSDVDTWTTHVPLNSSTVDDCPEFFHDYWTWEMGGQKYYMPKALQDLGNILASGAIQDTDATGAVNVYDGTEPGVKPTLNATKVITMEQWINEGMKPGTFWVIDADGWAYWAQALDPGDATGLLLSRVTLSPVPDDDYYYAINVIMQAASSGDWGFDTAYAGTTPPTGDALALLNKIAGLEATVKAVTITNGSPVYVNEGSQVALSANVSSNNGASTAVTWAVDSTAGTGTGNVSVNSNGIFTAAAASAGTTAIVSATSAADSTKSATTKIIVIPAGTTVVQGGDGKMYVDYGDNTFKMINDDGSLGDLICGGADTTPGTADDRKDVIVADSGEKYLGENANGSYNKVGPDGLLGTSDDEYVWKDNDALPIETNNESPTPPTNPGDIVKSVVVSPASIAVTKGDTQTFTAAVTMGDNSTGTDGVTWSIDDTTKGSSINSGGVLTVGASETNTTLIVTATSKKDGTTVGTATVTVKGDGISASEITAAGFKVVAYADASYAITGWNGAGSGTAKYALITTTSGNAGGTAAYAGIQDKMNTWFNSTCPADVKAAAVVPSGVTTTTATTVTAANHGISKPTATSAATLTSTSSNTLAFALSASEVYKWGSYTSTGVTNTITSNSSDRWWTRSAYDATDAWYVTAAGYIYGNTRTMTTGVRPALWVKIS